MNLLNIILLFFQILILIWTMYNFKRNPLSFLNIFLFMYLIFYVPSIYDLYFDLGWLNHPYISMFGVNASKYELTYFNCISTTIILSFIIGYRISFKFSCKHKLKNNNNSKLYPVKYFFNKSNFNIIKYTLLLIWFMSMVYAILSYNGNKLTFFMPSYKLAYANGYIEIIATTIPKVLFFMYICKQRIKKTQYLKCISFYFYCILMLLSVMCKGVRNDILTIMIIIFVSILEDSINNYNIDKYFIRKQINKISKLGNKMILLGCILIILIPATWYLRTIFNQLVQGQEIIAPWTIDGRKPLDILFGSGSSGIETSLILNYYDKFNIFRPFHSLLFLLQVVIPRSIFPDKLMTIQLTLSNFIGIEGNLSVFFINDVYFSFKLLSPLFSFIIANIVSHIYEKSLATSCPWKSPYHIIMLSNIITFFKNGFANFTVDCIFFFVLWKSVSFFVFYKKQL